ncbi:MAG: hypothetical protein M0Z77_10795 [Thermoplasmatales archaeon]|nr:hypothetical protein [Thermoplasmatales archaeon]
MKKAKIIIAVVLVIVFLLITWDSAATEPGSIGVSKPANYSPFRSYLNATVGGINVSYLIVSPNAGLDGPGFNDIYGGATIYWYFFIFLDSEKGSGNGHYMGITVTYVTGYLENDSTSTEFYFTPDWWFSVSTQDNFMTVKMTTSFPYINAPFNVAGNYTAHFNFGITLTPLWGPYHWSEKGFDVQLTFPVYLGPYHTWG